MRAWSRSAIFRFERKTHFQVHFLSSSFCGWFPLQARESRNRARFKAKKRIQRTTPLSACKFFNGGGVISRLTERWPWRRDVNRLQFRIACRRSQCTEEAKGRWRNRSPMAGTMTAEGTARAELLQAECSTSFTLAFSLSPEAMMQIATRLTRFMQTSQPFSYPLFASVFLFLGFFVFFFPVFLDLLGPPPVLIMSLYL